MQRLIFNKEENCFTCPICGDKMTYLLGDEYDCDNCGAIGTAIMGPDEEPSYMDFDEEDYYERLDEDDEWEKVYLFDHE